MNKSVCFMSSTLSGLNEAINKWLDGKSITVISITMDTMNGTLMNEYSAILIYKS